jgi:hypothetical protein
MVVHDTHLAVLFPAEELYRGLHPNGYGHPSEEQQLQQQHTDPVNCRR